MENFTKYPNFYPRIEWSDLRGQESFPTTDRLNKFEERRINAYLNGELDSPPEPEVDDEGYIRGHWTDICKVPKCSKQTDCPF
jgi:hypothetical protein